MNLNEKIIELEMEYGYIPSKEEEDFKSIEAYKEFIQKEVTEHIKNMQKDDVLTEQVLNEGETYVIS